MSLSNCIARLTEYYRRHGLADTTRRAWLALRRTLLASRMVVFYCDLDPKQLVPMNLPKPIKVKRLVALAELSAEHLQEVTTVWNPKLAERNMRERFAKGASLWLILYEDRLAGYGWTLRGNTIEPYYLPLAPDDVHFFDFHVFPQFRGKGLNPMLVSHIVEYLAQTGKGRAFIDVAIWNDTQLKSLGKTPFRKLALFRKSRIFNHGSVSWTNKLVRCGKGEAEEPVNRSLRIVDTNER